VRPPGWSSERLDLVEVVLDERDGLLVTGGAEGLG